MKEIPVWRMMGLSEEALLARAEKWKEVLNRKHPAVHCEVVEGRSTVGGGSLPGETLPTALLALDVPTPEVLGQRLRSGDPPVVGRIEKDRYLLDPRTVLESEEDDLLSALLAAARTG
jgi:L-seryl-tRNA(Ser) seleniumtransferase